MPSSRKYPLLALGDLKADHSADFFAQLCEKRQVPRDQGPFFLCKFRDAKRTVSTTPLWHDGPWYEACQSSWVLGQHYKIRGRLIDTERYGLQLEIEQIRAVTEQDREDGYREELIHDGSASHAEADFQALRELLERDIQHPPLRRLVRLLVEREAEKIKSLPATPNRFYAYPGGWLEHTLSVAKLSGELAERYQQRFPKLMMNRDLVVAGAVLHDYGRLLEVDAAAAPGLMPEMNRAGGLFGPHFLAFAAIRDAAREVPELEGEWLELLLHVVVSYLELPTWGSPRLPRVAEALIIHHADDLDAKLEMYARCLERDTAAGPFTARDATLGRELLKQRTI